MKNLIYAIIFAFGISICAASVTVDLNSGWKIRVADSNLYSDNGYIDYAEIVYLDKETYPDMQEMGLFWTRWDENTKSIVQVPASTSEGAALVDPTKPTLINVHGVLLDGHYKQEMFNLNTKIADPDEFDLDTNYVSMNYLWLREGWNVANFHYNRFASENDPGTIEYKIWSNEGKHGVRYRHQNGSYSASDVTQYSIAEHFAAEYIRAMRLLPDTMGNEEIRVAGHSMGGMLSTAAIFLLTELADYGQLPPSQLPNRYALLDPYFSTTIKMNNKVLYSGPVDVNIRWSGKKIVSNHTGRMMIECLKDLEANGIALEYYTYNMSFLKLGMEALVDDLIKLSAYSIVYPNFQGPGYVVMADGHNGVREWYLCSILADPTPDITYGVNSGKFAPSAAMSTQDLFKLRNTEYIMVDGSTTVNASDDTFKLKDAYVTD